MALVGFWGVANNQFGGAAPQPLPWLHACCNVQLFFCYFCIVKASSKQPPMNMEQNQSGRDAFVDHGGNGANTGITTVSSAPSIFRPPSKNNHSEPQTTDSVGLDKRRQKAQRCTD